ncbi:hypothetical protein C8R48DRAFT_423662 [Suillus tomentosus]|nr:hypothetical protein C8R48DRAFT_423662 [Suillus tomentosus]
MSSHEMFYPAKFTPPMKWWLLKILCAKFLYVWRMTPHCGLSRFVGLFVFLPFVGRFCINSNYPPRVASVPHASLFLIPSSRQ